VNDIYKYDILWVYSDSWVKFLITIKVVNLNPVHGDVYSTPNYVITSVSDLWQVGGFLRVLRQHTLLLLYVRLAHIILTCSISVNDIYKYVILWVYSDISDLRQVGDFLRVHLKIESDDRLRKKL
jgi:hypothetical protein